MQCPRGNGPEVQTAWEMLRAAGLRTGRYSPFALQGAVYPTDPHPGTPPDMNSARAEVSGQNSCPGFRSCQPAPLSALPPDFLGLTVRG